MSRRWIISMLGMYSCALMYVLRAGMGVAIVRMTNSSSLASISHSTAPQFNWSATLQGIILGAIFYLYWIVPTIIGTVTDTFGGKWLAFIGVLAPCILTAISPWAATFNVFLLIAIQTLIGAFQGFIYPALFSLYIQWFPPEERSKANSGIQVGQAFGGGLIYLIGGYLCETSIGWPLVFYVGSAFHVPWLFLWLYFASNYPKDNNMWIKNYNKTKKKPKIPWLKMATSAPVWSSILSKFACSYGFYMFLSKLPTYLNSIYNIPIVQNGFICAATFFSYGITCFLAPFLSNYMIKHTCISALTTRKIFQGICMLVPAICLIVITIVDKKHVVIAMVITAMFGYGFVTGGEWTMVSDYSPNFAGTVSGFISILGFLSGFLAPYIVGVILDSDIGTMRMKWNISFYISAILYILLYVAFWFLSTDQQEIWDKI